MATDDQDLLRSYVQRRDDDSFRLLTERYLGLIFHTALRRTGNHALSQEISQSVLCDLAKKAPSLFQQKRDLGPWLHRATIYQSSKAMRSEQTQLKLKTQVQDELEVNSDVWQEALPHLDEALNKLAAPERRILLLHYFDNLTFSKIADLIGKSPAATQKQARRALEKLSKILRRKGVTLSAVMLGSIISSEFAKAAPVNLYVTVPATVSVSALTTFLTVNLSKPVLVSAALLLAIPVTVQQVQISRKQEELKELQNSYRSSPVNRNGIRHLGGGQGISWDIAILARDFYLACQRKDFTKLALFDQYFRSLDEMGLVQLLKEATSGKVALKHQLYLIDVAMNELGKNPALMLDTMFSIFETDHSQDFRSRVAPYFEAWVKDDFHTARAWFDQREAAGAFGDDRALNEHDYFLINEYRIKLLGPMIKSDLAEGISFLKSVPVEERGLVILNVIGYSEIDDTSIIITAINETLAGAHAHRALKGLISKYGSLPGNRLEGIQKLFTHPLIDGKDRPFLLRETAVETLNLEYSSGNQGPVTAQSIPSLSEWLYHQDPVQAPVILGEAIAKNRFVRSIKLAEAYLEISGSSSPLHDRFS